MVLAGAQVVEELVDDEQDAVVRVDLGEGGHHLLEGGLVVDDLVRRREGVVHAELVEEQHQARR